MYHLHIELTRHCFAVLCVTLSAKIDLLAYLDKLRLLHWQRVHLLLITMILLSFDLALLFQSMQVYFDRT